MQSRNTLRALARGGLASIALLGFAAPALAAGGFGSVWVSGVTNTTIQVDWSEPTDKYAHCAAPHLYQVCIKEAGTLQDKCDNGSATTTTTKPYTFGGLVAAERYKVAVYTLATKNGKNCEFRKVATLKQETRNDPPPASPVFGLSITDTSVSSLDVRVQHSIPSQLASLRVCYRRTWLALGLNVRCQEVVPFVPSLNPWRGYVDATPPVLADQTIPLSGLLSCRQYKVVAYGLNASGVAVLKIGEANAHTDGTCKHLMDDSYVTDSLDDDHDFDPDSFMGPQTNLAQDYLQATDSFYDMSGGTQAHLEATYPDVADEIAELEADGDPVSDEQDLFAYLLDERLEVFESWQQEADLRANDLNSAAWLAANDPALYADLLEEKGDEVPALPAAGVAALVSLLLAGVAWRRHRR